MKALLFSSPVSALLLCAAPSNAQTPWVPKDLLNEPPSHAWHYLPNNGQVFDVEGTLREDVLFHSVGTFPTLYAMKGNRVAVCVPQPDLPSHEHDTLFRIDLAFTGAGANETTPVLMEGTPRRYNFYEQYTPQGVTDVTGGKRIVYPNVYDSIDVHLYSNQWGPKLYLVVRPGGNPNDITIAWSGQDSLNLDVDGFLKVWFFQKFIKLTQGLAYQQQGEDIVLVPWEATYTIDANGLQTGFQFGGYDPELPLILIVRPLNPNEAMPGGGGSGPPEWCTFLAGAHDDRMLDVTHDPDGNVYVTGTSRSTGGLPIEAGVAFQFTNQGLTDAVVGKFNEHYEIEDGAGWMTYFGGSDSDKGVALAYDQVNASPHPYRAAPEPQRGTARRRRIRAARVVYLFGRGARRPHAGCNARSRWQCVRDRQVAECKWVAHSTRRCISA